MDEPVYRREQHSGQRELVRHDAARAGADERGGRLERGGCGGRRRRGRLEPRRRRAERGRQQRVPHQRRVGAQPVDRVQGDPADGQEVPVRGHGHGVPGRRRQAHRHLPEQLRVPVPAAQVQRRPAAHHPAGADLLRRERPDAGRALHHLAVQLQVQPVRGHVRAGIVAVVAFSRFSMVNLSPPS